MPAASHKCRFTRRTVGNVFLKVKSEKKDETSVFVPVSEGEIFLSSHLCFCSEALHQLPLTVFDSLEKLAAAPLFGHASITGSGHGPTSSVNSFLVIQQSQDRLLVLISGLEARQTESCGCCRRSCCHNAQLYARYIYFIITCSVVGYRLVPVSSGRTTEP